MMYGVLKVGEKFTFQGQAVAQKLTLSAVQVKFALLQKYLQQKKCKVMRSFWLYFSK